MRYGVESVHNHTHINNNINRLATNVYNNTIYKPRNTHKLNAQSQQPVHVSFKP